MNALIRRLFSPRAMAAALVVSVSLMTYAAAESFDATKLTTIPLLEVVHLATSRYQFLDVADAPHRKAGLEAIASLDPKVRTLVWLAVMDAKLSKGTDTSTSYISTEDFVPQLLGAMRDAGMERQADVFAAAASHAKPLMPQLDPSWATPRFVTIDLGPAFGTKDAFGEAILAYVKANPAVSAWCDAARAGLSDQERLDALLLALGQLPESYKPETLAGWPEPYRQIRMVAIYEGELFNGGIEQYFWNSSGALAPATVPALRAMNLPHHAAVIEKGIELFDRPYPTNTVERRHALRSDTTSITAERDRALEALTSEAEAGGDIGAAMSAYAKREGILPR